MSTFLKIGVTSANFKSLGNCDVRIPLLITLRIVSLQISKFSFRSFGGMFLKVFSFLELRLFNSCSTSDEEITFRENVDSETVSLIYKMLGYTLYFFSAILIGSLIPLVSERRNLFSWISRDVTAFLKKELNFSETSSSVDTISFSCTSLIFFPFCSLLENIGLMVFQKFLLSVISLKFRLV